MSIGTRSFQLTGQSVGVGIFGHRYPDPDLGSTGGGAALALESIVDQKTGRKCYLDLPSDYSPGEEVIFILSLHGGGSAGAWQREYFPAYDHLDAYRLVIATPSAATKEPMRHWAAEADDDYLVDLAESVVGRLAPANIRAFWLVGHSQGGLTSRRLLSTNRYFADRVDGWLSLSGGRLGLQPRRVENFGPPCTLEDRARMEQAFAERRMFEPPPPPTADFSFVYATGELEISHCPRPPPGPNATGPTPASALRTWSTTSRARSTTGASTRTRRRAGVGSRRQERPRSTCSPTLGTAGSSPTSCGWTRAIPKASSR